MKKPTPNPPETEADATSPYTTIDSKKLHEAAERALDYYLNPTAHVMATPYTPNQMYFANPKADTESLLAMPASHYPRPRSCSVTSPRC